MVLYIYAPCVRRRNRNDRHSLELRQQTRKVCLLTGVLAEGTETKYRFNVENSSTTAFLTGSWVASKDETVLGTP